MCRKRHILVDTLGNLLHVVVHPAALQDREGANLLLEDSPPALWQRLEQIRADGGYRGKLVSWVKTHSSLTQTLDSCSLTFFIYF